MRDHSSLSLSRVKNAHAIARLREIAGLRCLFAAQSQAHATWRKLSLQVDERRAKGDFERAMAGLWVGYTDQKVSRRALIRSQAWYQRLCMSTDLYLAHCGDLVNRKCKQSAPAERLVCLGW